MKKLLYSLLFAVGLITAACGVKTQQAQSEDTPRAVLTVDSLLATPAAYVDSLVSFEGVCSHACRHGATKIFVLGDDGSMLRVEAGALGSFDTRVVHSPVKITGWLREQRIDEEYLQSWAERAAVASEQHGDGEVGCEADNAAHGVDAATIEGQIAQYREKIAQREREEGKAYLSFYFVEAQSYEIEEAK